MSLVLWRFLKPSLPQLGWISTAKSEFFVTTPLCFPTPCSNYLAFRCHPAQLFLEFPLAATILFSNLAVKPFQNWMICCWKPPGGRDCGNILRASRVNHLLRALDFVDGRDLAAKAVVARRWKQQRWWQSCIDSAGEKKWISNAPLRMRKLKELMAARFSNDVTSLVAPEPDEPAISDRSCVLSARMRVGIALDESDARLCTGCSLPGRRRHPAERHRSSRARSRFQTTSPVWSNRHAHAHKGAEREPAP